MVPDSQSVMGRFDRGDIEGWACRKAEEYERIVRHAEKLSPQEQCATALGFVTLNPPF